MLHPHNGIALVGISCIFPGAPDLDTYWQNIIDKIDAISDPPPESWAADTFYDPASAENDRVYCKRGGFISPLATFNPLAYGVMPRTVEGGEPDQWLALQVAQAALADAGYGEEIPEAKRTAVIIGKGTYLNRGNLSAVQHGRVIDQTLALLKKLHPDYDEADLQTLRQELKKGLPPFNADTAPGLIPNIIAGRIANRLNLMGPSYTVDGACASSLLALEIAVRDLLSYRCDLALVGGAHVVTPVPVLMLFCQLNALSRREQIRPFDKNADGTLLGEGIGMVVLKRLEDALQDNNRIYAVIRGVGSASDGRGLSVMAPRLDGELLALERAYEMAALSPQTVGLIEAHGTGTPVGDATEIKALATLFGSHGDDYPKIAIGSVKSMIGHIMPAAGMAGLIKAALALYHKVLPPTLHVDEPHPALAETPFYLNTETRPWIHSAANIPRRAGINAFGFGGINAHVILEEAPAPEPAAFTSRQQQWPSELLILSAPTRGALLERIHALQTFLRQAVDLSLKDLAYTLNVSLTVPDYRLAVVATDRGDLSQKLQRVAERLADTNCHQIKDVQGIYYFEQPLAESSQLAFLFPGEGSQYLNMMADLCLHLPEVREHFDMIDRVFAGHDRGHLPSDIIFPRPSFSVTERAEAEARLWQMEGAIEAVLTANRAFLALLNRLHIQPDALVGHSTGEYSAMLASGMIRLDDEAQVKQFTLQLNDLYRHMAPEDRLPQTRLLVVAAGSGKMTTLIDDTAGEVFIALDNCPHQTVIVCVETAVERVKTYLQQKGFIYEQLSFSRPYHTPLFEGYLAKLRPFLQEWIAQPPAVKTYSCASTLPFTADTTVNHQTALKHWIQPVQFQQTIQKMYEDGIRLFVEVGAGGNLTTFVKDILRGQPHIAIAGNIKSRSGITQLHHLLALLVAQKVPMSLDYLYQHRSPRPIDLRQPGDPYGDGIDKSRLMKLGTGWPALSLSDETAAQLRAKIQPPVNGSAIMTAATPLTPPNGNPIPANEPQLTTTAGNTANHSPKPPSTLDQRANRIDPDGAVQVMSAYQQTMNQFLSLQEDVMLAYLDGQGGNVLTVDDTMIPTPVIDPPKNQEPQPQQATAPMAAPEPKIEPEPTAAAASQQTLTQMLLRLVSERTGYPEDMLDLNLDLEAELGIDSIKRVEILGSLQQQSDLPATVDMERLSSLKTLQAVIDFLSPDRENGRAMPKTPPFITRILSLNPGQAVTAICDLALSQLPGLLDHTLGRHIATAEPQLRGLPIVPLTLSMELLAEVASLLAPGFHLIEMRDIQAHRWLALEREKLSLELYAERRGNNEKGAYYACLREVDAVSAQPIVEGIMLFAAALPPAPLVEPKPLAASHPSQWQPDQLYRDGMFHGPTFQGVHTMDKIGRDGAEATLIIKPLQGLLPSTISSEMLTDPILLDQPGQVVGFWTAETLDSSYVIFPYYLQSLQLYAYQSQPGEMARCQAHIQLMGQRVRSDLAIMGGDGRLWAKFEGWEDLRFDLPEPFYRFLLSPQTIFLSQPWSLPLLAGTEQVSFQARRLRMIDFPDHFFAAHGGIWQKVLAYLILNQREREQWHKLTLPEPRRLQWLLGRLVAKDAVRHYLAEHHNIYLCPGDIELVAEANGRPQISGSWLSLINSAPILSISHSHQHIAAIVGPGSETAVLGLDIEQLDSMNDEVAQLAFSTAERSLLADIIPPSEMKAWLLRLWCAKEAVAKAYGQVQIDGPRQLIVRQVDQESGTVSISLSPSLAATLPDNGLTAVTSQEGDLIIAVSIPQLQKQEMTL